MQVYVLLPIQHCTGDPSYYNKSRKTRHEDQKGRNKTVLADYMIVYAENTQLRDESSKVVR